MNEKIFVEAIENCNDINGAFDRIYALLEKFELSTEELLQVVKMVQNHFEKKQEEI